MLFSRSPWHRSWFRTWRSTWLSPMLSPCRFLFSCSLISLSFSSLFSARALPFPQLSSSAPLFHSTPFFQIEKFHRPRLASDHQARRRNRQTKPLWPRAPRIDVEHSVFDQL